MPDYPQPDESRFFSAVFRRRARMIGTAVVGVALVAVMGGEAAGVERRPRDLPEWELEEMPSVPVTDAKTIKRDPDPAEAAAVEKAPDVAWPSAGTARVSTAAPAAKAATLATAEPMGRAGGLPVWAHQTADAARTAERTSAAQPNSVDVEVIGRQNNRLLLQVERADGLAKAAQVTLGLEYEGFRHAYGGDWASRLHLVELPQCALRTPAASRCQGTVLATHNDGSGRLWADVTANGAGTLYAVQAADSGPAGTYAASKLSQAATWSVGDQSGDFSWNYPIEVPPAAAGPSPELALTYSSGGVDGLTSATNNQPGWAGQGFQFTGGGSIERRYRSCSTDKNGNNGTRAVGDLCWATDNAHLSLEGSSTDLLLDDTTKQWRPRNDDGSKIERHTSASNNNGARNGEYWVVTAKDGTKFYFGLNRLPGWRAGDPETNSVFTVPVFGNHAGEPCHKTAYQDSWCQQAYLWNLDYVVDRHGNAMAFFYEKETNNYARNSTATTVSTYVRGGHLDRIEYGLRDGSAYDQLATARVVFGDAPRCIPGSECTTSKPATYPDTPLDRLCTSTTNCGDKTSPTFWTTKRLAKVTTQIRRGSSFADVESWSLRHSFPDPGDGTRAGLWLDGITNTGHVGGEKHSPEVNFDGIQLPNRVDGIEGIPQMNWWRISAVHYGTGGALAVTYSQADCTVSSLPQPATNGRRCYPTKWTPRDLPERQDWFNKYVVTEVTESDRVSGLEPVVTKVEYLSPPAWRFAEEDGLVDIKHKTWAKWRGYEHIKVRKGHADGTQSVTETRFFRGMDGDRLNESGGRKEVTITDSTGTKVPDAEPLTGAVREEVTYDGTTVVNREITDQWVSKPTAKQAQSWGTNQAFQTEQRAVRQIEAADGGSRRSGSENFYADDGTLTMSADYGEQSDPGDDTCTRYEYVSNPDVGLDELPMRRQIVSKACDAAWTKNDVLADERVYYDGATSLTATPTRGDITKVERLTGFDSAGQPQYQTVATMTYDALGRNTSVTDALNRTSSIRFEPATGGPVTKTVETLPDGKTRTAEYETAWGEEIATIDEAGLRTDIAYDPLGRTSAVWEPGQAKSSDRPTFAYEYDVHADAPNVVTTKTLQANGSVETTYELFDGLMRPRQTQQPAPGGGRIITDMVYDSRGLEVKENGPYYNDAPPNHDVAIPNEAKLPIQQVTTYDGAERPTKQVLKSAGVIKQTTEYSHAAGRHTTTPPNGEAPTVTLTNIDGQRTSLRQFSGGTPTSAYDETTYAYTKAGQLASVTDPAGNTWSFEYDVMGRLIAEHDPDTGTTTYKYDKADQLVSQTNSKGETIAFKYDKLGRKIAMHEGSLSGPELAGWVYDTLSPGQLTSSTRSVNGKPYTVRVTGYDDGGRPMGHEVVIPESEGELAGTYAVSNTYTESGEVATTTLPKAGDLPAETLKFGYNAQDLPTTLRSELGTYVSETQYTPFGEVESYIMEHGTYAVQNKFEYDTATRRLTRAVTERELSPSRVANVTYQYDPSGNVTKITDEPAPGLEEPVDTQCFGYDHLRRLTEAWTPTDGNCSAAPSVGALGGPAPYWTEWSFDKVGNRRTETQHSASGTSTSTYTYPKPGEAQPHALLGVETTTEGGGSQSKTYGYDATGNLTERTLGGATEKFDWDAEGNLAEISSGSNTTSFVYDADGNRLMRKDNSGTTLYLEQTEIKLQSNGTVAGTRYYLHGEEVVASRTGQGLTWLGADHHGTAHIAIDNETQQVQRRRTDPYGNVRGARPESWPNSRGFVGGVHDPGTGLTNLEAREYDPTTGRFISVDPVADYADPQQLQGYAYANNSPVTFTDPDGEAFFIPVIVAAVRLVPVAVRVVKAVPTVVRTVAPVVRKVATTVASKVKNFFSWLGSKIKTVFKTVFRTVTTWVTRIKTVIKRVVSTVTKMKRVVVRKVKRVPVKKVAKKPASRAKSNAKKTKRNTSTPKKARPKKNSKPERRAERARKKANKKVARAIRRAVRRGPQTKEERPTPTIERTRVDERGVANEVARDYIDPVEDIDPYRPPLDPAPGGPASNVPRWKVFVDFLRKLISPSQFGGN